MDKRFKITKSSYNPRTFSKENRKALKKSIEEFSDISGITINEKTGNIVSGNHRWEELNEKHGELELKNIFQDRFAIMAGNKFTGFIARVVNWSLTKEKQANITANSPLVMGEFSSDLQAVLKEIANDTDEDLMDALRLSDIMVDMDISDEDLDLDNTKREAVVEKEDEELDDENTPKHSEVRDIISSIKVTFPSEYKDEILDKIHLELSKLEFYDKISIS